MDDTLRADAVENELSVEVDVDGRPSGSPGAIRSGTTWAAAVERGTGGFGAYGCIVLDLLTQRGGMDR